MQLIPYSDTVTFTRVVSGRYANTKTASDQEDVPSTFIQNTGFVRAGFKENVTSDAICFPDPTNPFIVDNVNRLEGMYLLAPLFEAEDDEGWYKVESVTVNRDHLLENNIDNIELNLKKTRRPSE